VSTETLVCDATGIDELSMNRRCECVHRFCLRFSGNSEPVVGLGSVLIPEFGYSRTECLVVESDLPLPAGTADDDY
jgi:hypothetical protein